MFHVEHPDFLFVIVPRGTLFYQVVFRARSQVQGE